METQIVEFFEEYPISIIEGMWDATAMCKKYERRISSFLRTDDTQRFIESLKKKHGLTDSQIIRQVRGKGKDQGTWVHQKLALKLAAWLNSDFEVWVFDVIEKLFTQGEVKLKDEIEGLKAALSESQAWVEVREHQLEEAIAESRYHELELQARITGNHPDLEEVGCF